MNNYQVEKLCGFRKNAKATSVNINRIPRRGMEILGK
jgi:hypothetical protein